MEELQELIPLAEVGRRLGLAWRTVTDSAWRRRVGLAVVRVGPRGKILGTRPQDLRRVLRRERLDRAINKARGA